METSVVDNIRKQAEGIEIKNLIGSVVTVTPGYAFDKKFQTFKLSNNESEVLLLRESFVRAEDDKVLGQKTVYLQPEKAVFADKVMISCKVCFE